MEGIEVKKAYKFSLHFNRLNSILAILVLLGSLILVNLLAEKLPFKYDMTFDKIFSLSDHTRKVIEGLDRSVNVIAFYQEGKEDATVKALLQEYVKAAGGKIKLEFVDADKNPMAAKRFDPKNEGLFNESIVFQCGGSFRKLTSSDIYTLNNVYGKAFNGEQQFTGALLHVTSSRLSRIYFLEGHQESSLSEELLKLKSRIESEANIIEGLNLLKAEAVPGDADMLVVASPKRDLSPQEKGKLQDYLAKGGKAMFLFDVLSDGTKLTHFAELLKGYGVGLRNNFIVEENREFFYSNNKMYLVPDYTDHMIVKNLNAESMAVIFPYSLHLEVLKTHDKNLSVEPFLTTSKKAWIRYNVLDGSAARNAEDAAGPGNVAVAVTRDNTDDRYGETRLLVTGNAKFLENNMLDVQGNVDLFMNAVSWVGSKKESISIRPKMMNSNQMVIRGAAYAILLVVSVLVIPMLAFGSGLILWWRRRNA